MKHHTGSFQFPQNDITAKSGYSMPRNFNLLAGVKDEYHFPGFDSMLSDLLKNESDYGIYPQVGKYSEIFNHVNPKK